MRITRALRLGVGALALAVVATGCGAGSSKTAAQHAADGKLTVGIKFDQPGLGLRTKDGSFSGFDVDVARYVAGKLGVKPENIAFKEAPSAQRETLIQNGQVDFIAATYSITDQRKEKVDFAGPYYVAGQDLLVRADNTDITGPESLKGKKVCSVKGSTPAQNLAKDYKDAQLQTYDTYSLCIEALKSGSMDAVSTDNVILAGYAAQSPGQLKLVNKPFTTEKYGIGLKKGDKDSRDRINDAIEAMFADGSWKAALDKNFGGTGFQAPQPPTLDRY
ncbi:glutamate ABC transporter substrate-binding protein [Nocardia terpenica]|uniref:Glutamate-binding protein n=1 Tax=Nocardia terpenica TaxID=455432 RepID=A0A164NZQ0_9NOCA|nr:glutamate ABC transporter substrate-binding protein [Nocardia terpenica]KZM74923.1 glutamate-binding protein [Nocardia terpenica]NQE93417.1 glutamate ABC transporter substrate-binding protein [Nocardia terpenica]